MSLRGRNRVDRDMDLHAVISFLQMILCMAAGITVLALIGMALSASAGGSLVVYQMTLAVDGIMLVGGGLSLWRLKAKSAKIEERKIDERKEEESNE